MIPLTRYFEVEFLDPRYSFQDLFAYGSEQIIRLAGSDLPAVIAERIAATQAAMTALDDAMANNTIKIGLQKGQTAAKAAFRASLPVALKRIYGAVLAAFGEPSAALAECFPSGRGVFHRATDEQVDDYLAALSVATAAHAAGLPAATVADAAGLLGTWTALFGAAKSAKGSKKTVERSRQELRRALALELYRNVLTLGLLFPGDLDKAAFFCPQDKLDGRAAPVTAGATTLSAGMFDPVTGQIVLTMAAENAETFTLKRRVMGEAEFTVNAAGIKAVDGTATFTDTVATPGTYEYMASAFVGIREGERSGIVRGVWAG